MKGLLIRTLAIALVCLGSIAPAQSAPAGPECIKVGDYFPAPVDFGREPKITLTGINAQALIAKMGAEPEDVEATDTIVIFFVALPMETPPQVAAMDLRFMAVYQHGCLADGGMIPFGKIEHLIPGV